MLDTVQEEGEEAENKESAEGSKEAALDGDEDSQQGKYRITFIYNTAQCVFLFVHILYSEMHKQKTTFSSIFNQLL